MKKVIKKIFKKKVQPAKKAQVTVINKENDNRCLCERVAEGENIHGFCFKHHTDWA
jgi:hypothetical protein